MVGYNVKYEKEMGDFNLDSYFNNLKGREIIDIQISNSCVNPIPSLHIHEKGIIYLSSIGEAIHETEYSYMIELIERIENQFYKLIEKRDPEFLKIARTQEDYYFLINYVKTEAPDLSIVENELGGRMKITDEI